MVKTCVSKFKQYNQTKKHIRTFFQESIAIAIENEKVAEIKTILTMQNRSDAEIKAMVATLNCLINKRAKLNLNDKKSFVFLKKFQWKKLWIGRNINCKKIARVYHDNMLHYACRHGKLCLVDALIDEGGFNVNARNKSIQQDTPISIAVDFGWIDSAKFLLKRGATVNIENAKFKTPLILATELKYPYDIHMVKILIRFGAKVDMVTHNKNTALLSASKFGNIEIIKILLRENANINCQFNDGVTGLMRACYYNYIDVARLLLNENASIETTNSRRETALFIASFRGNYEIVKLMVDDYRANINSSDIDGDTPLTVACYENKPEIIHYLLNHGACVNTYGIRGDTPLHIAISNCDKDVVRNLIQYGANVDAINLDNETPLLIAVQNRQNNFELISMLCEHAECLDVKSNTSGTPLKSLLENLSNSTIRLKMLACLILAGCDVIDYTSNSNERIGSLNSSPLKYLFQFHTTGLLAYTDYRKSLEMRTLTIDLLAHLIELIIKVGYKPTRGDYHLYKQSWLFLVLETQGYPSKTSYIESLFSFDQPDTLTNMCRVNLRKILKKPLHKSICKLFISQHLKSFLLLKL